MKSDAIHISLELELRRDRIGSWCTEADIISTGCIPVVFIKEIVAPRRKCHRLPSEMGIPRNPGSTSVCLPVSQWMPVFPALYAFSSQTRSHPSFNGQVFMLTESPLLPKKWPPAIPLPAWSHMLFTKDYLLPSNPSMRRFIISVISAATAQSYNKISTSKNTRRL